MEKILKYIKEGQLDIRIRILFLMLGVLILLIIRPWIARQSFNRGVSFLYGGYEHDARRHFQRAVQAYPKFVDAYNELGRIYEKEGKDEKALSMYENALAVDWRNVEVYFLLSRYYAFKKSDYQGAVYWLKKVLKIDERNWLAYRWLGIYYEAMGLKDKAFAHYQAMQKVFPDDERIQSIIRSLSSSIGEEGEVMRDEESR